MRRNELCLVEITGQRVSLAHEGDDTGLLSGQALRHTARMGGILRLNWNILPEPATALTRVTHHNKKRTHGRLPACSYMRHHDSYLRTQQERKRFGEMIRKVVKGVLFSAALGTSSGGALAAGDVLCGGRVHDIEGKAAIYASADEALCPWGFTVDKLVITCETRAGYDKLYALTATAEDGRTFALNGIARQWLKLESIGPIWKDREDIPGAKVDISPWMKAGESICQF